MNEIYVTDENLPDPTKHNYYDKVEKLKSSGILDKVGVYRVKIEHDEWCKIYKGGYCDCNPNVSASPDVSQETKTPNNATTEIPVSSHNLPDFINPKCRDCHGRGLVQRRIEVAKGEWRSAKLMCDCIDRNVKKRNLDKVEQGKLLTRILEALKHREAQKAN